MDADTPSPREPRREPRVPEKNAAILHADFNVVFDATINRVHTRFVGVFTAAAMQAAAAKVERALSDTQPGFSVLADLSQVTTMDLDCVPHLTRIMDLCRSHGVSRIVRLLPEPERDIGINLLSIVHYRGEVKILTVATLEEAERALA